MDKLKQFDKIFGVSYEPADMEKMFVNKIENFFYNPIEKGEYGTQYSAIAWHLCVVWGLNQEAYKNGWTSKFQPLNYFTESDFVKTLKLVVTLYQIYKPTTGYYNIQDVIDKLIPKFINESPSPLGIQWHSGMFYKTDMPEMTDVLVNENLDWLSNFPAAKKDMELALKNYSAGQNDGILDNIYKAVENVVQKITGMNAALHNKDLKIALFKKIDVTNSWKQFLDHFISYSNDVARHGKNESRHDVSNEEIEACFFLSLTILRLISKKTK